MEFLSAPEVGVGFLVDSEHGLRVGPGAHDLFDFVFGHIVLSESHVVAEDAARELIGHQGSQASPPCHTEYHVERNAQGSDSAELVVTTQVVDANTANSSTIECKSKGEVASELFLLLGEQELVWLVLQLSALCHCTFPVCHF